MTSPLVTIAARSREIDLQRLAYPRPTGVYFLILDEDVVYIGQSTDIDCRIALHVSQGEKVFNRAFWIEVPGANLDAYEGALIRAFAPRECMGAPADTGRDEEILASLGLSLDPEAAATFFARRRARWPLTRAHPRIQRRKRRVRTTAGKLVVA